MKREILLKAKQMARSAGFHDLRRIGIWKGGEVCEPIFTDGEPHFVGLPSYIINEGGKLRWTADLREAFAIADALPSRLT